MKKKILSVLLCLCMVCMLLPTTALAAGEGSTSISNFAELQAAFSNGGDYTLAEDINVTGQLTLDSKITINGNEHTINGNGHTITYNSKSATITNNGTLTIKNLTIDGNQMGGRCISNNAGTLTMEKVTLTGASLSGWGSQDTFGAGLYNAEGATAILTNCNICDNINNGNSSKNGHGGGFYNAGKLIMENCAIVGNKAPGINSYGGGGGGYNRGTLYMNNCTVANNQSSAHGGGIYHNSDADTYLMNCTVTGNISSGIGGGITINGGSLYAVNSVFAFNYYNLNDPTINDIYGSSTLYSCAYGQVTPEGSTISGCKELSTATVTDLFNAADSVKVEYYTRYRPAVTKFTKDGFTSYGVYPATTSALRSGGTKTYYDRAGFTVQMSYGAGNTPLGGLTAADNNEDAVTTYQDGTTGRTSGVIGALSGPPPHVHALCQTVGCMQDHDHTSVKFTAWESDNALPTSGTYYLTKDVTLSSKWQPTNDTVLCLNGHTITMKQNDPVIVVWDMTFTLTDCGTTGEIRHDQDFSERGVFVGSGTFNMYGGTITGNNYSGYGGGGGVHVSTNQNSSATFNMYDGEITGNTATKGGGGVYVDDGCTFKMSGDASITGNNALYEDERHPGNGGGVYVSGGTFTMSGGSITGNEATTNGGGVYVKGGTFTMSGGTIGGDAEGDTNTATDGGGVYVNGGTFKVSGSPKITGNHKGSSSGDKNNVYLPSGKRITVDGALNEAAQIGVTKSDNTGVFTSDWGTNMTGNTPGNYFDSDAGLDIKEQDGELYLVTPHKHALCRTADCTQDHDHTSVKFTAWTSADSLPTTEGNYYLTKDVVLSSTQTISENVTLCLNGHTITKSNAGDAIKVNDGAAFTLTDCSTKNSYGYWNGGSYKISNTRPSSNTTYDIIVGGSITHSSSNGGGVLVLGTFNMYGGTIAGNTTDHGVGVYVYSVGTFNMYGGSITGNTTIGNGGGVYAAGTFNMYGGSITGNTASFGGGVYAAGTFTMSENASITGNTANNRGGGVYVSKDKIFNMSGDASITGNTANYDGGGVYVTGGTFGMSGTASISGNQATTGYGGGVFADGTFKMSGGSITGNKATGNYGGGGVYVSNGKIFNMSGTASITGNEANTSGGVYVYGGTFEMSGTASITGNTANTNGGGVYVDGGTFEMSGTASITSNKADCVGGGVYVDASSAYPASTFTMSGGTITGNKANIYGGGVYVYPDSKVTMTVSGEVSITGNTISDKANNVYLWDGESITVAGALTGETTSIGVTTKTTPTSEAPITIAQGQTGESAYPITSNDAKRFSPDAGSDYIVTLNEDNTLSLKAHQHSWRYNVSQDGKTITATCGNSCPTNYSETLTISASNATYDGTAKPATLGAQSELKSGLKDATITYKQGVTELDSAPTNAGTYTASITVGTGESAATASVEYTIAKAGLTVTANDHTITYGDAPAHNGVTYDGFVNSESASNLGGTLAYTYNYTQFGNVGGYTITPSGLTSNNYDITFVPGTLTVAQREVTLTWNNTDGRTAGDGKYVTATAGNLVNSDVVTVTVSGGDETTAGNYTATAIGLTGEKEGNYKLPSANTKDYTIGLAAQTLTFQMPGSVSKTYGDEKFTNTATNNRGDGGDGGAVTYSSSNAAVATVNSSTGEVTIEGAGTATITANAAAVDGKYSAGSASYTLNISKATVTVSAGSYTVSKVYDGGTAAGTGTGSGALAVSGILTGDDVTVTATPVAYTDPNVGGQANMNVSIALTGAKAGNYQLASSTVSVPCKITKKPITISSATVSNKPYDGNANATVTAVTIPGVSGALSMDTDFTVTSATFPDADADGANVDVTINVELIDTAATNYTLTNGTNYVVSSAAKITALDIGDATVGDFDDMTYNGEAQTPAATVTKNGLPATGTWSNVTNVTDTTTFTASGNFTGTITGKTPGMAQKIVDALDLSSFVTAPVNGDTPQSDFAAQTQYTGTISWDGSPAKFLGNTVYTATLTLTATDNYTFTGVGANSFTYSGATVANEANSGTVTITFPATPNAAVSSIAIKEGATYKTAYKVGDLLDVTGLVITATMDDSTTTDVNVTTGMVSAFDSSAVTGSQTLTITYGGKTTTYTISVGKADQTISAENVTAVYGDTGKSVVATNTTAAEGGKTPGALSYAVTAGDAVAVDAGTGALTINKAGTATVTVTAVATDTCAQATRDVTVTVNKATITVTANNQSIYVNDAAPNLSSPMLGTHYTVTGLVGEDILGGTIAMKYQKDSVDTVPNVATPGTYDIVISGAEAPVGDNYDISYVPGTLTISARPVAPSSGGSYTPPTYKVESEVTEDTDGSVSFSKSNAKKGETVTITVTPDRYYKVAGVTVKDKNGKEIAVTDNGDGTFTFKMPDSKVVVEPVFSWDNPFTDVSEEAYYTPAVEWALKNDITDGTGDGTTFSPDADCTRAQMVTFLWRAAGSPEPTTNVCPYTDVDLDSYYGKAALWAAENGITKGTSTTTFSPDMECSRAQMAAFLCRMADGKPVSGSIGFTDVPADAYYAESVQWAAENNITEGTGAGKYSPNTVCTRGQMVTFLYRWLVK